MNIVDTIRQWWQTKRNDVLYVSNNGIYGGLTMSDKRFANVLYANIYEILTDLTNDVTLIRKEGDIMLFSGYKNFFDNYGQEVLNMLFERGYAVIGRKDWSFWIMRQDEYYVASNSDESIVRPYDKQVEVYVMKSISWQVRQISDKVFLSAYLDYLDKVLNGSYTISERLGSFLIMSPANPPSAPTVSVLSPTDKDELEKQLQSEYGALKSQKSVMLLKRPMTTQVINLAGLDQKTSEKVKMAVLAICDRIKVPANQVAIIDANSNKTLANGSELREGDFNKYQSFERLLNRTFIKMASDIGLSIDYTIYNKPIRNNG